MAGVAKKHLVDGEWITVAEAAERLGVTRQQIYNQMNVKRIGLQTAVNLIRDNLALNGQGKGYRYMVDGRWMTIRQAAEMLNITPKALRTYMYRHRCTLSEAVETYRSKVVVRGGSKPKQHRVGRKTMTTFEAANMLGIDVLCLRTHMSNNKATLAQTIRYYEAKKKKKAEKDILNILGF